MTRDEWGRGMAKLLAVGLAGWPSDPQVSAARAAAYREALNDLDPEAWLHAAAEAAKRERWFPVPAVLREYAEAYRPQRPGLPPVVMSEEERERRHAEDRERMRESSRRGLAMVEEALRERGVHVHSQVVESMPVGAERRDGEA